MFLWILFLTSSVWASRSIPALTNPVIDEGGFFKPAEQQVLEVEIRKYLPELQFQVWTVNSLEGEPIEALSIRAVDQWKLGAKGKDNGVLMLISRQEKGIRLEVGRGLEGEVTDALVGRIIDRVIKPNFRQGDFLGGVMETGRILYEKAGGKLQALPQRPSHRVRDRRSGAGPMALVPGFFLAFIFLAMFFLRFLLWVSRFQNRGRYHHGSRTVGSSWGSGSGGGFGGGFGGGGGGGGWSGGGGGFSGGGGSGNW